MPSNVITVMCLLSQGGLHPEFPNPLRQIETVTRQFDRNLPREDVAVRFTFTTMKSEEVRAPRLRERTGEGMFMSSGNSGSIIISKNKKEIIFRAHQKTQDRCYLLQIGGNAHTHMRDLKSTMVIVKEYRLTLPLSVEEYAIAQLYTVIQAMKGKGSFDKAQIVKNEPFTDYPLHGGKYDHGQFTHKIYRVEKKVPTIMRWLVKSALTLHERSWNCYPYTLTYMGQADPTKPPYVITESIHLPDRGTTENPLGLPEDQLSNREVVYIDIGAEKCEYGSDESQKPYLFTSRKTGRGPFIGSWRETVTPVMTCYKLVTVEIKILGFQSKVENYVHRYQAKIMANFHRDLVCLMDEWAGKTLQDIREEEVAYALQLRELESESLMLTDSASAKGKKRAKSKN